MRADGIGGLGQLPHEELTELVGHQQSLGRFALDRDEPHARMCDSFADCGSIRLVGLASLDARLHI